MVCIICKNPMVYYFSKPFTEFGLKNAVYYRCPNCGFGASKTHFDMVAEVWETLNLEVHNHYSTIDFDTKNRPPPYLEQAVMLHVLKEHDLISEENWLDWGSGKGKLAHILDQWFSQKVSCYDRYIKPGINPLQDGIKPGSKYDVVINSAVFEHVTSRANLDEINNCVSENGVLAVHTLVREDIPEDKDWFYLLPVHCAFHTNRSMDILLNDWGYKSSVYCPNAKMWVFFRVEAEKLGPSVQAINKIAGFEYLFIKSGFMDYWKL